MKPARIIVLLIFCCVSAAAQEVELRKCSELPVYAALDFWLGEWEVYSGEEKVGENIIDKVLNGCAIMEHWTAAGGGDGMSLFYVDATGVWQQIWVTEWSANPGGVKEKTLVETMPNGSTRFRGELEHPKIGSYLDRTTLTPMEQGEVRQLIEISRDGGETWQTSFDAVYKRVGAESG